jgi:hypothetical protein
MMLKLKYYSDPGHGWIAVKLRVLYDLGIVQQISPFSYMRGKTAYLEEDCDMLILIEALKDKNILHSITDKCYPIKLCPIRSYDRYDFNKVYLTLKG